MLSISEDLEKEDDGVDMHDTEDDILLEDTPGMEEKGDIALGDEGDEVIITNEEDEIGQAIEKSNLDLKIGESKDVKDEKVHKKIKKTTRGDTLHVNVEDQIDNEEETHKELSDAYCNSDGTNCEEERGENIYVEVPDPKPVEDIDIPLKESPKKKSTQRDEKKSKQTSEKNSNPTHIRDDAERKGKKDSASSPEELEEELRTAYKSTQKKSKSPKVQTSNLVNLEGCQKLLDQAQVRTTSTVI